MNLPDLLDDATLADALGCTTETVQERTLAGDLPGVKFGRSWVYPREAVLEALNRTARLQAEARAKGKPSPAAVAIAAPTPVGRARRELPTLPSIG